MQSILSRWFMFALLFGWAMTHATVFGQGSGKSTPETNGLTPIEKIRQGLDKAVTFDFVGQSVTDTLNHFREKTGVPMNVDHTALMMMGMNLDPNVGVPNLQAELKAKNEKASTVLRRFLNGHRLTYIIFEDSLLVTTEEMAVMRQMRQRVSVNVEEVPLKKAAGDLAKNHGVNLVIDRAVGKEFVEAPVSLQVDGTGIETALRLLAEQGGLKAVRMGNVMFITTAGKAKTIREEEPHQLDSPLNPNIPGGGIPAIAAGFGGGGFGGIAMPGRGVVPAIPQLVPPAVDLPGVPDRPVEAPPVAPKKVIPLNPATPAPPVVPPTGVDRPAVPVPPIPQRRE